MDDVDQQRLRSSTARTSAFEAEDPGAAPGGASTFWKKAWDGLIKFVVMGLIVTCILRWLDHMDRIEAHQETEILELKRINNMLELQYHEMVWTDETFDDYCEENPEGCEITQ